MKHFPSFVPLYLMVLGGVWGILFTGVSVAQDSDTNQYSIQVKSVKLRGAPKHWARGTATLEYGDQISVVQQVGGWFEVVTSAGQEGFLHESALTEKRVLLKSKARPEDYTADQSDIVLAGKGFNREIEQHYQSENASLNYAAVDEIEAIDVSTELYGFMAEGQLFLQEQQNG